MLIEWVLFGRQLLDKKTSPETKSLIQNLANFFLFRNYIPFDKHDSDVSMRPLTKWPYNVIFKLKR